MAADKFIPHHPEELEKLLSLSKGCTSILEIGSRYGHTLDLMARTTPFKKVVAVDLPGIYPWGEDSEKELKIKIQRLREDGYDAHLFIGDSSNEDIVSSVFELGPFDMVFIDGDHHYEGVLSDWRNYGHLGKTVVFHDIVQPKPDERQELEVWKLWQSLNGDKEEFVGVNSKMGLGVLRQCSWRP